MDSSIMIILVICLALIIVTYVLGVEVGKASNESQAVKNIVN